MGSFTIKVDIEPPFEEVAKRVRNVDVPKATQAGLEEFAFTTERFSKQNSPIDTGRLRSSITTDIGDLRARVAPHVKYALFVHEGTKRMAARPFMTIGLTQANAVLFNGKAPFVAYLEKEFESKLGT